MRRKQQIQRRNTPMLGGEFWTSVGQAFTDPDKQFQFPIKPFEMDLTKETKILIIGSASVLAMGMIVSAYIRANK